MILSTVRRLPLLVSLILFSIPGWSADLDIKQRYIYTSLYTTHYDPEPEHVNDQNLFGFEIETEDRYVYGFSLFDNSFGQDSEYLYMGYKWQLRNSRHWYFKLTGGLLHGYKEPYEDKIPLNDLGIAPAIIPTLGFQYKNFVTEFNQAGLSAAMITAGFTF